MLTLLHAGDFHLDTPFRSLPPREAQRRRREQRSKEKAAQAARRKPWAPPQAKTPL